MSAQTADLAPLRAALTAVSDSLVAHPAFRAQAEEYAGKVFFMYDFINRTISMLDRIPHMDAADPNREEALSDVPMRAMYADVLIKDRSGKLDSMCVQQANALGQEHHDAEFTEDVLEKSKACAQAATDFMKADGMHR